MYHWWEMLMMEHTMHVWGWGTCAKSLYTPLHFAVNLKLLLKIKSFFVSLFFLSFSFFFFFFYKKSRKETQNKTKKVLFKLWFRFLREGASKAVVWLQSLIGLVIAWFWTWGAICRQVDSLDSTLFLFSFLHLTS